MLIQLQVANLHSTSRSLLKATSARTWEYPHSPGPSRCWPPGASPPAARPPSSAWPPGTGESADAWHDFLTDLKDRGLASPLLIISDGAPGLISAIEQAYPRALRQRCVIHRARNILAKIPAGMQAEVKDAYWKIFDTADLSAPSPNLIMKPGTTPADLHRIPDATSFSKPAKKHLRPLHSEAYAEPEAVI